uniref:Putative AAA ATPase n=1 Tax=uncultured marine virus TaxID=186617 RepID=A0A0F7L738_9VIRU|nr:putative AAA ATPase [uncultured marine virus]
MDDIGNLLPAIAERFLGEPSSRRGVTLAYGTHGSLKLDLGKGTWFDHENDVGGGVVDLLLREVPELAKAEPGSIADYLHNEFGLEKRENGARYDLEGLRTPPTPRSVVATYQYRDESGAVLYEIDRIEWIENGKRQKTFRQHQVKDGQRLPNKGDARSVLWRLPEILASTGLVVIGEGEKTVQALVDHGFYATTCDGGSKNWDLTHSASLRDRDVLILPDNDDAGRAHADKVAASLKDFAASVRILELPDLPHKGDAYDWFAAGHTATELRDLADSVPVIEQAELQAITPIPVMSMLEVMSMPPNEWLVEGQIPEKSVSAIYGPSGSGKTFLALDMMLSVAHDRAWQGNYVREGAVFYIAGEGVSGLRKRLHAWHKHHQVEASAPFYVIGQAVILNSTQAIDDLIQTIDQVRGGQQVQAVVFDTLARCFGGDENDARAMGEAIQAMDLIKRYFDCAVVAVHHTGKSVDKGLRGSSALLGALDSSLQVTGEDGYLRLKMDKQKDDIELGEAWFSMDQVKFQAHALDDPQDKPWC